MGRQVTNGVCEALVSTQSTLSHETQDPLTVLLCAGIDDARICMCKLGQFDAILFAQKALVVATFPNVVDLYRFIARRRH